MDAAPRTDPTVLPRGGAGPTPPPGVQRLLLLATSALALAVSALAWQVQVAGAPAPGGAGWRAVLVVASFSTAPGVPLALALRLRSRGVTCSLAVSASWATTVLAAQACVVAGWWHPAAVQSAIALLTTGSAAAAWRRQPGWTPVGRLLLITRDGIVDRARPLALLAASLVFFWVQARLLDAAGAGPAGVITQLGWPFVASVLLLGAVVAPALVRRRVDGPVLAVAAVVLVVIGTMLVSTADGETSVPTAWVHRGFIDVLAASGHLPPPSDARFSWAGFFSTGAHLVTVAGIPDATVLLAPAPLVMNSLLVAPLFVIGRAVTNSTRTAWVGVFVYLVFNWYQQDYFSPQAMAMELHLSVLAALLWWWRAAPPPGVQRGGGWRRWPSRALTTARRTTGLLPGTGARQVIALEALLVVLLAAMVVSHQLTPPVALASLLVLSVTGSTRFKLLWLSGAVLFIAWFSFGAQDYWLGNLHQVVGDVGDVGSTLEGGVSDRVGVVPEYQRGQYLRLASSAAVAALAVVGWWLRRGFRGRWLTGLLAATPFALVLVQSYGGEVVIRCFVLASPLLAPLAAHALVRAVAAAGARTPRAVRRCGPPALVLVVALGAALLTGDRGLNTSFERTTRDQVRVADAVTAGAPAGADVLSWGNAPYLTSARALEDLRIESLFDTDRDDCVDDPVGCTLAVDPDYVFLTPNQEAQAVLTLGAAPGWLDAGLRGLVASGRYAVQVDDPSVTLLRRVDAAPVEGAS